MKRREYGIARDIARDAYRQGMTVADLADATGLSPAYLRKWGQRYGCGFAADRMGPKNRSPAAMARKAAPRLLEALQGLLPWAHYGVTLNGSKEAVRAYNKAYDLILEIKDGKDGRA